MCIQPILGKRIRNIYWYYYEVFLTDKTVKSSIGSGGRYDNAIGGLIGTNEKLSTVGISFGLDVIYTAIQASKDSIPEGSNNDFYIMPINTQKESLKVASYLRGQGYKVELEMGKKKLGKALDKANKEKVRNVIIIGEEEVKNCIFKIKDMLTGEERTERFVFNKLC